MSLEEEKIEMESEQQLECVETKKRGLFSRLRAKHKAKKAEKLKQLQQQELSEEEKKKVKEKLEEAAKEVSKQNDKKKKIKNIIFFILNIVLVAGILIWNVYSTEGFTPFSQLTIRYEYIAAIAGFLLLIILIDVITTHRMIYKKTLRSRWNLSFKSIGLERYYDAITPMAAGGQAFMATYLTSRGVPGATSMSIPIAKLLFQNIGWLIVTFVCLIYSFAHGLTSLVSVASIIGFVLCAALVIFILFMSLSKKLGKKMVSGCLKLLVKMRILKDYDKYYTKVSRFVEDYQTIMKEYSTAKFDVVFQIVMSAIRFVLTFSIPYLIYLAFPNQGGGVADFTAFFVYTAMIDLAASFIPLPGGTGMNEITFTALFSPYLKGATFWALLIWRFCTYYWYLIQGLLIISYDTVYGNRKYRWIKKKYSLQAESQEFRRVQIDNFRQERTKRRKQEKQ